jgi:hypothetical protein
MKKSNHGKMKATKEEYVFNQLYQNQTALYYWAFRLRLNLYNLANLTLTQLTKPEFTGEI